MASKKKCFVISPIGDENSEIRKEADALLWVAKSALEKFDFDVIRVDQIARSTTITNEIIQLIQESELCLIVLTGHNPNVFYEAGRRHETGRPFIQLMRKGETLPFDVASIRTILYDDIQALSSAAKVVEQIQKFIDEFEKGGYGASGTGVSLSTIAAALDRIERKVGQLMAGTGATTLPIASMQKPSVPAELQELEEIMPGLAAFAAAAKDPQEAFLEAILTGNLQAATQLLPKLESRLPPKEFTAAALMLVAAKYEPAVEIAIRMLEDHFDTLGKVEDEKEPIIRNAIASIAAFYISSDREDEALARLKPIFQRIINDESLSRKAKAWYKNQIQRLLWGVKRYEEALSIAEEVIELDPDDPIYWFNLSLIYEKLNLTQKSINAIDKSMAFGTDDEDQLRRAVELYAKAGRVDEAKKLLAQLRKISPLKAMIFDEDVRQILGIKIPGM